MTRTVVACKTGSPIYMGADGPARGDADAPSVVKRLLGRGDCEVVLFGQVRGEVPPGVVVMQPELRGINRYSSGDEIAERLVPFIDALNERDVAGWVDVVGYSATWTWPDNDMYSTSQDSAVRYSGCNLYTMEQTQARRFTIVTDPKCYPRSCEMARMWPHNIPQAVLSQEDVVWDRRLSGEPFRTHAVYGACEFWLTEGMTSRKSSLDHMTIIAANPHINAGMIKKNRDSLWAEVLDECFPDVTKICGSGWEKHPYFTRDEWQESFVGCLPMLQDVYDLMATGFHGPVLPQKRGFNSTKPRLYALNGCVPRLFGDGEHPMTYDADARILPLNHPSRWHASAHGGFDADETIELVLEATTPNWSKLDALVDRALKDDVTYPSLHWLSEFGGMVKL